jgi:hypothetical protein
MSSLNYSRILEMKIADIHNESWKGNIKVTEAGRAAVARYRSPHGQVGIQYKGKPMIPSLSGWVNLEAALEAAREAMSRYDIDQDSEAEVIVTLTLTDHESTLVRPEKYHFAPNVIVPAMGSRGQEIFRKVVFSSKPSPEIEANMAEAEVLLNEGEPASKAHIDQVKALFAELDTATV